MIPKRPHATFGAPTEPSLTNVASSECGGVSCFCVSLSTLASRGVVSVGSEGPSGMPFSAYSACPECGRRASLR